MFSKITIMNSTGNYSQQIEQIQAKLNNADAVVIGAGAGLSTSAGLTYSGERFYKHFSDFAEKYGITDMYSGGFYPGASVLYTGRLRLVPMLRAVSRQNLRQL